MRKEVREVWIAEDDSEHGNEADALRADRVVQIVACLGESDYIDWRDCDPRAVAEHLVGSGYMLVPITP